MTIWTLDTEDNSKGKVYLITFFDGETHHTFKTELEAIEFLYSLRGSHQIWATNLQYDINNVFRQRMELLEVFFISSRVITARLLGTGVKFYCTLNHWKISVKGMGERIGLEKLETKDFNNILYNQRDAEISHKFVLEMKNRYERFGARLKTTIGSTSCELFFREYHPKPVKRVISDESLEFMLKGYYGGRSEIFFNKPISGSIWYFDVNSLYPYVMKKYEYPSISEPIPTKDPDFSQHGMVSLDIDAPKDLYLPYLPMKIEKKLIFPVGELTGTYTFFEIKEALKLGYKIKRIHKALEFKNRSYRPFQKFVTDLYQERLAAQQVQDLLMADGLKLIMNNLYGKFAQGRKTTKMIPFSKQTVKNLDLVYGNVVIRTEEGPWPKQTNIIWSALTTAYGRHELYQHMQKALNQGAKLLYCDTDSLIFEHDNPIFEQGNTLGALKLEGHYKYAEFRNPKMYRLIESDSQKETFKAKGVPRAMAKDFFLTGKAAFEKPNKLKESLRRKLTLNEWCVTKKEARQKYDKRRVKPSGETHPIIISRADKIHN